MAHKFRELVVWQRAMDFVTKVYALSQDFPQHERYGLTSQLRRAAVSIALNIAEGAGCESHIEFARFLTISLRSAYETMTALEIAVRLSYCDAKVVQLLLDELDHIAAMLSRLAKQQREQGGHRSMREEGEVYNFANEDDFEQASPDPPDLP